MHLKAFFEEYLENDPSLTTYFPDCIGYILVVASNKGIEFEGYFQTMWEREAQNPFAFDEEYFENYARKRLYVLKAALCDREILGYLQDMYEVAGLPIPNEFKILHEIQSLQSRGVSF